VKGKSSSAFGCAHRTGPLRRIASKNNVGRAEKREEGGEKTQGTASHEDGDGHNEENRSWDPCKGGPA